MEKKSLQGKTSYKRNMEVNCIFEFTFVFWSQVITSQYFNYEDYKGILPERPGYRVIFNNTEKLITYKS